jgi:hypothetical protein
VVVPTLAAVQWDPAYRIIATRFPAVDLWAGVARDLWARLDQVEAMTSPRLQAPPEGTESAYVQWPFSNPRPGRFSTAALGAFYAALEEPAAIAETLHYQAIRCREDHLAPHDFDMRVLGAHLEGTFHDVRGRRAKPFPHLMDPGSHAASRSLAEDLAARGSQGVVFDSVRDAAHGPCVAAFTPGVVRACRHLRYLTYRWTGEAVAVLYEKRPYPA